MNFFNKKSFWKKQQIKLKLTCQIHNLDHQTMIKNRFKKKVKQKKYLSHHNPKKIIIDV